VSEAHPGVSRLVCLRHAESENVIARQAGALPSAPLTSRGRQQASAAAAALSAGETRLASSVYASDAVRARQTAEVIAAALGLRVTVLPGLSEVAMGSAEGATDPAVLRQTADVLKAWVVDGDLGPRVADGESGYDVAARVTSALTQIAAGCDGRSAIVVGHVASLTVGVSELCRNGPSLWGLPLPHAAPFPLTRGKAGWHADWPGTREPLSGERR